MTVRRFTHFPGATQSTHLIAVDVLANIANCREIAFSGYTDGFIRFASGYAGGTLSVYHAAPGSDTFEPAYDAAGTAITIAVSGTSRWQRFPEAMFALGRIKFVAATAAGTIEVIAKS